MVIVTAFGFKKEVLCFTLAELFLAMILTKQEKVFVTQWYDMDVCTALTMAGYTLIKTK